MPNRKSIMEKRRRSTEESTDAVQRGAYWQTSLVNDLEILHVVLFRIPNTSHMQQKAFYGKSKQVTVLVKFKSALYPVYVDACNQKTCI